MKNEQLFLKIPCGKFKGFFKGAGGKNKMAKAGLDNFLKANDFENVEGKSNIWIKTIDLRKDKTDYSDDTVKNVKVPKNSSYNFSLYSFDNISNISIISKLLNGLL